MVKTTGTDVGFILDKSECSTSQTYIGIIFRSFSLLSSNISFDVLGVGFYRCFSFFIVFACVVMMVLLTMVKVWKAFIHDDEARIRQLEALERVSILTEFYKCSNGHCWTHKYKWLTRNSLNLWKGVKTDSYYNIRGLVLKKNNLTGRRIQKKEATIIIQ